MRKCLISCTYGEDSCDKHMCSYKSSIELYFRYFISKATEIELRVKISLSEFDNHLIFLAVKRAKSKIR